MIPMTIEYRQPPEIIMTQVETSKCSWSELVDDNLTVGFGDIQTHTKYSAHHLSLEEQKVMKKALLKSSSFIAKGKFLG